MGTETVAGAWAALGVRAEELPLVRRLFLAAFTLGVALVFFYGGANTLFLTQYDSDVLAWVYIANAAMVAIVGLAYGLAARRLTVAALLIASTVLIAVSVTALWLWASLSDDRIVAFMMATWFRLLFIFALLGLWEIASVVFDIRQAKRLFPAVAVGVMIAFVIGGLVTGLVAALAGTTSLVLVSAVAFWAYAFGFAKLVQVELGDQVPDDTPPAGPRAILADPHARLLALMRSATIMLVFIGEFIFYEQAAATFESEDSLATFLGIFIAASTVIMVIVTAVVSAKFIARHGVRVGLITMPAGIGIVTVIAAAWGTFVGVDTVFFVLIVVANLVNMTLANAIEMPVGALMFQPLPPDRRMPIRVAVDGWLGSVALIVTGFLLLGFAKLDLSSVAPFAWLLVAVSAAGVIVAGRLHDSYVLTLDQATTRAFRGTGQLPELDDMASTGMRLGVFGATADTSDNHTAGSVLDAMMNHSDPTIVDLAVQAVVIEGDRAQPNSDGASDRRSAQLQAIVTRPDMATTTRSAAAHALVAISPGAAAAALEGLPGPELRAPVLAAQLLMDPPEPRAGDQLRSYAASPEVADRVVAADSMRHLSSEVPVVPVDVAELLLVDPDDAVRRSMLGSLEGKVDERLVSLVVAAGKDAGLRRFAVSTLAQSPPEVLDHLDSVIDQLSVDYQADLVSHVYSQHTRRPVLLHRFVAPGMPSTVRAAGFTAIEQAAIAPPASAVRMLRDDVVLARHLAAAYRDVAEDAPAVGWALAAEFGNARASIYAALTIDYPTERIRDIAALADRGEDDDRANAIEALDVLLQTDLRRSLVPILEPRTIDEAAMEFTDLPTVQRPADWYEVIASDGRLSEWTRRTAAIRFDPQLLANTLEIPMTELIERIAALKSVDIFSTLPYPLLAELATLVTSSSFAPGEVIIAEGALDQELFALTSGRVTVTSETTAVTLDSGTVFGELALLSPAPRSATVTAATQCEALVVRRSTLLALADRRPELMVEIASVLATRLRE